MAELTAYAARPAWFALGDRDLGTHLVRTQLLNAGYPLSEVTAALAGGGSRATRACGRCR